MSITGKCYCGALRYDVCQAPQWHAQCHCRECQYLSGGGPNYFMIVPKEAFTYTKGTPSQFTRPDLENAVTREFCATCGTHMTTCLPNSPRMVLKVGTLDDPSVYTGPQMAIYMCDSQPFHTVAEGIPKVDKLPPR